MMAKPWWESRGVWGALIAALSGVAGIFGFVVTTEEQIQTLDTIDKLVPLITPLASLAGGVLAFIGRVYARSRITTKAGDGMLRVWPYLAVMVLLGCAPAPRNVQDGVIYARASLNTVCDVSLFLRQNGQMSEVKKAPWLAADAALEAA